MQLMACILISFTFLSSPSLADGFTCKGQNTGYLIRVFNHNFPSEGTRKALQMIINDPALDSSNQKLAEFSDTEGNLRYLGNGIYLGKNSLNFISNWGEQSIAGMPIAQLGSVTLDLDFAYTHEKTSIIKDQSIVLGKVSYQNKNNETRSEKVTCLRYLRNPPQKK